MARARCSAAAGGGPAGQDEGVQGRERGLQAGDLGLERGGARGVHARLPRRGRGAGGQGQLGAEVEEVALEVIQGRVEVLGGPQGAGEAERARQLVEGAVGVDTDIVLGGVGARAQVGLAGVAGRGVRCRCRHRRAFSSVVWRGRR